MYMHNRINSDSEFDIPAYDEYDNYDNKNYEYRHHR